MPSSSELETKLLSIYNFVNDWLKFAEAKNAGVLAFSGVAIGAMMGFLASSSKVASEIRIGLYISMIFFSISVLLALLSFLPKTKISFENRGTPEIYDNLYFYGHLCKYKPQQLVETVKREYFEDHPAIDITKNHLDIAEQIVINSQIAMMKYEIFNIAVGFIILAVLVVIVVPIFLLILFNY